MDIWSVAFDSDRGGPHVVLFSTKEKAEKYCCDCIKKFLEKDFDEDLLDSVCEQNDVDFILESIKTFKYAEALEHFMAVFYDFGMTPYLEKHEVQ